MVGTFCATCTAVGVSLCVSAAGDNDKESDEVKKDAPSAFGDVPSAEKDKDVASEKDKNEKENTA